MLDPDSPRSRESQGQGLFLKWVEGEAQHPNPKVEKEITQNGSGASL